MLYNGPQRLKNALEVNLRGKEGMKDNKTSLKLDTNYKWFMCAVAGDVVESVGAVSSKYGMGRPQLGRVSNCDFGRVFSEK